MNAAIAELKAANAAANQIRFYAPDMLRSQACRLTAEHRAILVRQADALRAVLETDELQAIRVNVYDVYRQDVKIGEARFTL